MIELALTGLTFGFLGSLHCVAMCGPLALALPAHRVSYSRAFLGRVLYNIGRIVIYAAFGVMVGLSGHAVGFQGAQKSFSLIAACVLFAYLIISGLFRYAKLRLPGFASRVYGRYITPLYRKDALWVFPVLGIANGLLPCGLVFAALAVALASGGALSGTLFMGAFGAGTFPAMLAISLGSSILPGNLRSWLSRLQPAVIFVAAVVLLWRGWPITPAAPEPGAAPPICAHEQSKP